MATYGKIGIPRHRTQAAASSDRQERAIEKRERQAAKREVHDALSKGEGLNLLMVYKLRDGVEFEVNRWGCLIHCNDWETLYDPDPNRPDEKWRGINRDLFKRGFGGAFFATKLFCKLTGFQPIRPA